MTTAIMLYAAFMQTVAVFLLVFQSRMMWLTVTNTTVDNTVSDTEMSEGERAIAEGPYETPTVSDLMTSMQPAVPFSQLSSYRGGLYL